MKLNPSNLMTAALSGLVMTGFVATANVATAQDAVVEEASFNLDDGAAAQINLSGKLRMLSQKVTSAACQVSSGYDVPYATGVLEDSAAEFAAIVDALEFGNPDMGIPYPEERRITLAAIADVRAAWEPVGLLVEHSLDGTTTNEELDQELEYAGLLLEAAKTLTTVKVAQYSNPAEMAAAESFLIDIAGRQRMLIQRISLTSCLTLHHNSEEESRASLGTAMSTFEATLSALQTGMPSVGIRKPPTAAIAEGLAQVSADYADIRPILQQVLDGQEPDLEVAISKFKSLNELMATMNGVVGMYVATVDS